MCVRHFFIKAYFSVKVHQQCSLALFLVNVELTSQTHTHKCFLTKNTSSRCTHTPESMHKSDMHKKLASSWLPNPVKKAFEKSVISINSKHLIANLSLFLFWQKPQCFTGKKSGLARQSVGSLQRREERFASFKDCLPQLSNSCDFTWIVKKRLTLGKKSWFTWKKMVYIIGVIKGISQLMKLMYLSNHVCIHKRYKNYIGIHWPIILKTSIQNFLLLFIIIFTIIFLI